MQNQLTDGRLKKQILVPLAIAFAAFLCITLFQIIWLQKLNLDTTIGRQLDSAKILFADELNQEATFIASQLDFHERNPELQQAFLAGDRQRLLAAAAPLFQQLHDRYQLTHFYFIRPDRTCFLRAHKPDFHGDPITRLTLLRASENRQTESGLELGPLGTLTLRVVRPWLINGELAGYLEIGRDIQHILPKLAKVLNVQLIAAVNATAMEAATHPEANPPQGAAAPRHLIIGKTMPRIPSILEKRIVRGPDNRQRIFSVRMDGRKYHFGTIPLTDLDGRHIGEIFVLQNFSTQEAQLRRTALAVVASTALFALLIFLSFYRRIGQLERHIHTTTASLRIKTEQYKLAQEAVQDSANRYQTLVDTIPHGVQECDTNGIITFSNPAHHRLLGYKPGELVGKAIWDLHTDEEARQELRDYLQYLVREQPVPTTYSAKNRTQDGRLIDVEVSWDYQRNQEGVLTGFIATITDITERQRAEEALRESEDRYRDLIETASDMIQMVTPDGRIIYANLAWRQALGYGENEIHNGLSIGDIIEPRCRDTCLTTFARVLKEGTVDKLEATFVAKDGRKVLVEGTANCRYQNDRPSLTRCIFRDVTEKREAEQRLLRAQKLDSLGVLAGGIAHDFNNLLTVIVGNISLAKLFADENGKLTEILTTAEKASARAAELTKQLLTFSKGGAPVRRTTTIGGLIKDSARFVLAGANVRCVTEIDANLWPLHVDEGQLSQVINNLVLNASQAMPHGGIITITAENTELTDANPLGLPAGRFVKIAIHDQGPGIDHQHLAKIFDPYYTTKETGSGLGLAVSYSIVKKHDGLLTVHSQSGVGTTFYIYLPAVAPEAAVEMPADDTTLSGEGKILVMDDEEIIREVASQMLGHLGYQVATAWDGREAIALYQQARNEKEPFAAVIMDLTIPGGMGGKETIAKLKAIAPEIRAVVSSGYANDPIMAQYRDYGFAAMVSKPYKIQELSRVLYEVLRQERDKEQSSSPDE